jgi:mono/diheme cytochrome c family protein
MKLTEGTLLTRARTLAVAVTLVAALHCLSLIMPTASAQNVGAVASTLSTGFMFTEASGEALYANVCQACHMSDGKGATGAGTYPALASDKTLEAAGYAVDVVVKGRHAMPPVGTMLTDDQVASVINYVRTHFDNHYRDEVTPADVKAVRH